MVVLRTSCTHICAHSLPHDNGGAVARIPTIYQTHTINCKYGGIMHHAGLARLSLPHHTNNHVQPPTAASAVRRLAAGRDDVPSVDGEGDGADSARSPIRGDPRRDRGADAAPPTNSDRLPRGRTGGGPTRERGPSRAGLPAVATSRGNDRSNRDRSTRPEEETASKRALVDRADLERGGLERGGSEEIELRQSAVGTRRSPA